MGVPHDEAQPARGSLERPGSESDEPMLVVPARGVHPCVRRTVPVLRMRVSILHPGRARRRSPPVTPNDTECRRCTRVRPRPFALTSTAARLDTDCHETGRSRVGRDLEHDRRGVVAVEREVGLRGRLADACIRSRWGPKASPRSSGAHSARSSAGDTTAPRRDPLRSLPHSYSD